MRRYLRKDLAPPVSAFEYPVNQFEGINARTPERILPLSWAKYAYNVRLNAGALTGDVGISLANVNGTPLPNAISLGARMMKAVVFRNFDYEKNLRDDVIVAVLYNKKLAYARFDEKNFTDSGITLGSYNVTFLNYHYSDKDCMLIICDDGQMYEFDGKTFEKIERAPKMTCACVHNGRVYGGAEGGRRLFFSDELDPKNWNVSLSEGGYIDFPDEGGNLTGVMSFKGNLYIFREYAVHRLSACVNQSDYVMSKCFYGNNRIYFPTAADCGDKMMFFCEMGFITGDGYTFSRTLMGIDPIIEGGDSAISCYFGGKYHISCKIRKDDKIVGDEGKDGVINNGIISYDLFTGETAIFRGAYVSCFIPVDVEGINELFVLFGNVSRGYNVGVVDRSGALFGTPLPKLWESPVTDLTAINKDKVLKRMYIRTPTQMTVTVVADGEREYVVAGTDRPIMIRLDAKSNELGLKFSSDEELNVRGFLLQYDNIGRKE